MSRKSYMRECRARAMCADVARNLCAWMSRQSCLCRCRAQSVSSDVAKRNVCRRRAQVICADVGCLADVVCTSMSRNRAEGADAVTALSEDTAREESCMRGCRASKLCEQGEHKLCKTHMSSAAMKTYRVICTARDYSARDAMKGDKCVCAVQHACCNRADCSGQRDLRGCARANASAHSQRGQIFRCNPPASVRNLCVMQKANVNWLWL